MVLWWNVFFDDNNYALREGDQLRAAIKDCSRREF